MTLKLPGQGPPELPTSPLHSGLFGFVRRTDCGAERSDGLYCRELLALGDREAPLADIVLQYGEPLAEGGDSLP